MLAVVFIGVAIEPATALLFGAAAVPLWLALFAGRRGAGVVLRGAAIAGNALSALACAWLLVAVVLRIVQGQLEGPQGMQVGLLFAALLVLNLLNMRALVGPGDDAPAA